MALEGGLALKQPAGKLEEGGRVVTSERECRINEGVRFDERTVKINTKGRKCCDLGWGGRNGQRSILPIEDVSQGLWFVRLPNAGHVSISEAVFAESVFLAGFLRSNPLIYTAGR